MDWLKTLFSGENSAITLVTIVVGLAIALVLLAWVFRKIAGDGSLKAGRSRQPRLSVTDAAVVDEKRRLVLVRRDNVEHLIMIGGPTDFLIEQNIARVPLAHHAPERTSEQALAREHAPAHGEPAGSERGGERGRVRQAPPRAARPSALPEQALPAQSVAVRALPETATTAQHTEAAAEPTRANAALAEETRAGTSEPEFAEFELTAADLEAEMAADDERQHERAAVANGHDEASAAAQPEIEIDLDELQMEIDRPADRFEGPAAAKAKVAAPSLDVAESVDPQPARKSEAKAVRTEAKPAPEVRPGSRVKSMEDEMQRLLEELSGPARN